MNIVTLDFETYFDDDYTLKKLTTEGYIRDPRFKAYGCAMLHDGLAYWLPGPEPFGPDAKALLERSAVLCHHAQFDGLILNHHYGIKPACWLDTLSMAHYLYPGEPASLEALAARYGLPAKTMPYQDMKGVRDLTPELEKRVAEGAIHDCELTWAIFQAMMQGSP